MRLGNLRSLVFFAALLAPPLAPAVIAHELPLGDGKVSTTPMAGYLMSCLQRWRPGPVHGGPWINGDEWDPSEKPVVEGQVNWPTHFISITTRGGERIIRANNLPDHPTGIFPIAQTDPVWRYDHNPNSIRPQHILLRLPMHPQVAPTASCVPMGMIGFTTDGVAIYSAVDNGGVDAVAHEVQDSCNGHPQHDGQYHYHGPSPCMPNEMTSGLVGYALDGFGIYGMINPGTGKKYHDADLDACHGLTGPVMWNGHMVDIYHYVLTDEYPYTIGCFRGTPVKADFKPRQLRQLSGEAGPDGRMGHRRRWWRRSHRLGGF